MDIAVFSDIHGNYAALQTCIGIDINNPRIVKIKDTLHLSEIEVSENMLK